MLHELCIQHGSTLAFNTVRIVRSSSATKTVPSIYQPSSILAVVFICKERGSERRKIVSPGTEVTEIQPPKSDIILDTSAKTETSAVPFLARDETGQKYRPQYFQAIQGPSSIISICKGSDCPDPSARRRRKECSKKATHSYCTTILTSSFRCIFQKVKDNLK